MNILGIRVDTFTRQEALKKVSDFLQSSHQNMIFTPNPEMIVLAQTDHYFREVLNKGDLNLCDGKGIQLVSSVPVERIPGVDFVWDICELAEKEGKTVYLLGSQSQKILEKTQENLKKKFPSLQIVGMNPGPLFLKHGHFPISSNFEVQNENVLNNIIDLGPDIVLVAFGHAKQEKWIFEYLPSLPSVKIAMGVGGTFDYISGAVQRAPVWFQKIGLEWFWRLCHQPKRFFRIWNATVKFLVLFYTSKFRPSA